MENEKYQYEIIPMSDVKCFTDFGRYNTLCKERTLYKDLSYLVCNLKGDDYNTYFEMWDEQGFIGNYSIPNTENGKYIVSKYFQESLAV